METLSFENLVDNYYSNLVNTLRNFCPGPPFLETWVHDEATDRSIYALFEAAESAGIKELSLEVLEERLSNAAADSLKNELERLGQVSITRLQRKSIWTLKFGLGLVASAYMGALKRAGQIIHNEGFFRDCPDHLTRFTAQVDGVVMSCLIDSNQTVAEAKHSGASGFLVALLDQFCDLIRNQPIQEAAEHGVIRLEAQLRDLNLPPPVIGVITPDNADPIFKIAQKLIRKVYSDFLIENHQTTSRNTWSPKLTEHWLSLGEKEKLLSVRKTLVDVCQKLNLNYEKFEVVEIKNDTRIVLSGVEYLRVPNFGHHLMKIENELKSALEPELELVLESLEDRNKRKTHVLK